MSDTEQRLAALEQRLDRLEGKPEPEPEPDEWVELERPEGFSLTRFRVSSDGKKTQQGYQIEGWKDSNNPWLAAAFRAGLQTGRALEAKRGEALRDAVLEAEPALNILSLCCHGSAGKLTKGQIQRIQQLAREGRE